MYCPLCGLSSSSCKGLFGVLFLWHLAYIGITSIRKCQKKENFLFCDTSCSYTYSTSQHYCNTLTPNVQYIFREYRLVRTSSHYTTIQIRAVQCSKITTQCRQRSAVQCSSVWCNAVWYNAVQGMEMPCTALYHSAVLCSAVQFSAVESILGESGRRSSNRGDAAPELTDLCSAVLAMQRLQYSTVLCSAELAVQYCIVKYCACSAVEWTSCPWPGHGKSRQMNE